MVAIRSELDTVQQVKEEIEELREYVDRLEEHTHRRKLRLLQQVLWGCSAWWTDEHAYGFGSSSRFRSSDQAFDVFE